MVVTLHLTLTDRPPAKTLFIAERAPNFASATRSPSIPQAYFDESGTAMQRVSRDVARSVVTAILEAF